MGENSEYRILLLEDLSTDAEIIERELRKSDLHFVIKQAKTKDEFSKMLDDFAPDIILSDYRLPQFDGFEALVMTREKFTDIPFIMISGTLGDERAVEILKAGATDYILKDRIARLNHAVKRALGDSEKIRLKKDLETSMQTLEIQQRDIREREIRVRKIQIEVEQLKEELSKLIQGKTDEQLKPSTV